MGIVLPKVYNMHCDIFCRFGGLGLLFIPLFFYFIFGWVGGRGGGVGGLKVGVGCAISKFSEQLGTLLKISLMVGKNHSMTSLVLNRELSQLNAT